MTSGFEISFASRKRRGRRVGARGDPGESFKTAAEFLAGESAPFYPVGTRAANEKTHGRPIDK